jgi:hypothetical protein
MYEKQFRQHRTGSKTLQGCYSLILT